MKRINLDQMKNMSIDNLIELYKDGYKLEEHTTITSLSDFNTSNFPNILSNIRTLQGPLLDPVINFGKVTVSIGYDTTATSIILNTNEGSKLPDPSSGAFNLVWWNSTDYPDPSDDPNKEIVRCTAKTTDTLTVTRAQEGTTATTKNTVGKTYKMILSITARMITDISSAITARVAKSGDTMTGTLNLPSNGLIVGTNQLIVSGGNVGIGTTSPSGPLHVKTTSTFSATGGTITTSGGYTIHTFTSNGTFTTNGVGVVEYLIVGGGGGNAVGQGANREAGSGAGGMLTEILSVSATSYPITVGAGGVGHANGGNSTALGLTAYGGGYGANTDGTIGGAGGSGGGNWYSTSTPATGVAGQGNSGGIACGTNNWTGGGGGGAGSAGNVPVCGLGGAGLASSINGSVITYATGGRGNTYSGAVYNANGAANTGDGASGVGNGGSGIVIIRYLTPGVYDALIVSSTGNVYSAGNVSASSFTDRTPSYYGNALTELGAIKEKDGKIDHTTLPSFAKVEKIVKKKVGNIDIDVVETERDLGAMVSILTVAVQQLTDRTEKLERKLK